MAEGFGPAVLAWFNAKVESLENGNREAAIEAGDEIRDTTKRYISTRGTAKSGKQGRIETGAMLNAVDSEVTTNLRREVEVRAGYHEAPFYTPFQELGTVRIEAMYALSDAAEEVLPKLEKKLRANASRA